ncbi:hypothetical protein NPIL_357321, partial [Nephila pilipes]
HKLYGLFASDDDELNLLKELENHPDVSYKRATKYD